ncbi:signal peptidase II [Actinomyces slackii]|uniref:Lipoprotein signal peptidase n=1 Tax=Actinomyces slackii TaxID=52774 RepID=A0A3S5EMB7_9ACTO|nr:signal peptidase II [Actinomyces slackii]VEG75525.1 Lipoprotein signal peptidase [Actinomyces slackii]
MRQPFEPSPAPGDPDPGAAGGADAAERAAVEQPDESDRARQSRTSRPRALILLWAIAVVVIVVDQATKAWALAALDGQDRVALVGRALGLVLVRNPGAAFSFATGQTWLLSLVAIAVSLIIIRVSRRLASASWAIALGLVLGGAVGNLIDRMVRAPGVLRGHVIDFIDYGGYFVGNVADIAIVAAAGGIVVLSLGGWEIDGTRATAAQEDAGSSRRRRERRSTSHRARRERS